MLSNSRWRERWCRVRGNKLVLHKDRTDLKTHIASIPLRGCTVIPGLDSRHPLTFRLLRNGQEVAVLEVGGLRPGSPPTPVLTASVCPVVQSRPFLSLCPFRSSLLFCAVAPLSEGFEVTGARADRAPVADRAADGPMERRPGPDGGRTASSVTHLDRSQAFSSLSFTCP